MVISSETEKKDLTTSKVSSSLNTKSQKTWEPSWWKHALSYGTFALVGAIIYYIGAKSNGSSEYFWKWDQWLIPSLLLIGDTILCLISAYFYTSQEDSDLSFVKHLLGYLVLSLEGMCMGLVFILWFFVNRSYPKVLLLMMGSLAILIGQAFLYVKAFNTEDKMPLKYLQKSAPISQPAYKGVSSLPLQ